MKNIHATGLLLLLMIFLNGCATSGPWYEDWRNCAIAGATAGGAAGSTNDRDDAAAGAVGGAIIGGLICAMNTKTTPQPEPAPMDSDGDGVYDKNDQCPGTPRGIKVDNKGCELDSDRDGVVDSKDQCPNTARGVQVDVFGCHKDEAIVLKGVNFEFNSDKLTNTSKSILDTIASILAKNTGIKVMIGGHTDSRGNDSYNQSLSKKRADAVRAYLTSMGINASRLSTRGFGETRPIASNDTENGRAINRRVELSIQ